MNATLRWRKGRRAPYFGESCWRWKIYLRLVYDLGEMDKEGKQAASESLDRIAVDRRSVLLHESNMKAPRSSSSQPSDY